MSDIEFLMVHEENGRLQHNEGQITSGSTGTLASVTAGALKDLYLARAQLIDQYDGTGVAACLVELQINGTTVETFQSNSGDIGRPPIIYEFKCVGHKVDASQVIRLQVITNTNHILEGFVECVEVDDGDSPQL